MNARIRFLVSISVAAACASASTAQLTGWGTEVTGLYKINLTTGSATFVNSTGPGLVTGLAYNPNADVLYGVNRDLDTLMKIDPSSGAYGTIGPLGIDTIAGGLAFDRTSNTLYYMNYNDASLYSIDTSTGAATFIGPNGAGVGFFQGLAFDPNSHTLYATSSDTDSLYTVDTSTGAVTLVGPFGVAINDHGLGFDDSTNTLYCTNYFGSPDNLYRVDTATGALTVVGPLNTSINGFTVEQQPIPVCPDPVLWAQYPDQANGHSSDLDPAGGAHFEEAENVMFAQDVFVRSLRWWGMYSHTRTVQGDSDDFVLRVYEDIGGIPGLSPVTTAHLSNTLRVGTGNMVAGMPSLREYIYAATLPVPIPLEAGKVYWLAIVNNTVADGDDGWYWSTSAIGDSARSYRTPPDTGAWSAGLSDLAFELCGETYSFTCEPDLNGDGFVNGADLAELLAFWGMCPAPMPLTAPSEILIDALLNPSDDARASSAAQR